MAASTEPDEDLTQIPKSSESVARVYIQTIFGRFNSKRGFVGSCEQSHVNPCIDRVIGPRGPYSIRSRELWYRSDFSVIAFRRFVGVFLRIFLSFFSFLQTMNYQRQESKSREKVLLYSSYVQDLLSREQFLFLQLRGLLATVPRRNVQKKQEASAKRIQSLSWIITSPVEERAFRVHAVAFSMFLVVNGILVLLV